MRSQWVESPHVRGAYFQVLVVTPEEFADRLRDLAEQLLARIESDPPLLFAAGFTSWQLYMPWYDAISSDDEPATVDEVQS